MATGRAFKYFELSPAYKVQMAGIPHSHSTEIGSPAWFVGLLLGEPNKLCSRIGVYETRLYTVQPARSSTNIELQVANISLR